MNPVVQMLEAEALMIRKLKQRRERSGILCTADFILKHGREFTPKPLPKNIKPGQPRHCFMNSMRWLLDLRRNTTGLTYCEGYAAGIIPVLHGWLCNDKGEVIDRTWTPEGCGLGAHYFGIPFKTDYVRERVIEAESWLSLLDDWQHRYPLQMGRDPQKDWKVTI